MKVAAYYQRECFFAGTSRRKLFFSCKLMQFEACDDKNCNNLSIFFLNFCDGFSMYFHFFLFLKVC